MNEREYREYLFSCGFNDTDVDQKIAEREILFNLYYKNHTENQREITSAAYERSQKNLVKKVCDFLGLA